MKFSPSLIALSAFALSFSVVAPAYATGHPASTGCRAANWLSRDSYDIVVYALKSCVKGTATNPALSCAEGRELQPGRVFQLQGLDEGVGTITFVYGNAMGPGGPSHYLTVYGNPDVSRAPNHIVLKAVSLPANMPLLTAARLIYTDQSLCQWNLVR